MAGNGSSSGMGVDEGQEREDRLTAIINVLGHPSLTSLEDFIFLHGSNFKLAPTTPPSHSQDTQTQLHPALADSLHHTNFALVEKARARKADLRRLRHELEQVKAQVGLLEGGKGREVERREEVERDWRRMEGAHREVVAERDALRARVADAGGDAGGAGGASQADRVAEELGKMMEELQTMREELSAAEARKAELEAEFTPLRADRDQLNTDNAALHHALAASDKTNKQLEDYADTLEGEVDAIRAECEAHKRAIDGLEDELSRANSELATERKKAEQGVERELEEREGRRVAEREVRRLTAQLAGEPSERSPGGFISQSVISSARRGSSRPGSPALVSHLPAAAGSPLGRPVIPPRPSSIRRDTFAVATPARSPTLSQPPSQAPSLSIASVNSARVVPRDFAPMSHQAGTSPAPASPADHRGPPPTSSLSADPTPKPTATMAVPDLASQRLQYPKLLEAYRAQLAELQLLREWVDRKKPELHHRTKAEELAQLPGPPIPPMPSVLEAADLPSLASFEGVADVGVVYAELEAAHDRARRNAQELGDWKRVLLRGLQKLKEREVSAGYSTADSGVGREGGLVKGRKRKAGTGRKSVGGVVGLRFPEVVGNSSGPGSTLGRSSSFDGSSAVGEGGSSPAPRSPKKSPRKSLLASSLRARDLASPAMDLLTSTAIGSQESARSPFLPAPSPTARPGPSPVVRRDGQGGGGSPAGASQSQGQGEDQADSGTRLPPTPSRKAKRKSDLEELVSTAPPPARARTQARVEVEVEVGEARGASGQERPRLVGRVSSSRLLKATGSADSDATEPLPESSLPEPDTQPDSSLPPPEASGSSPCREPTVLVPPTSQPEARSAARIISHLPKAAAVVPSSSAKSDRTVKRAPLGKRDAQTGQPLDPAPLSPSPVRRARADRARPTSLSPAKGPTVPAASQRHLPLPGASDSESEWDHDAPWPGPPFSPPKKRGAVRVMEDPPPSSLLARWAGEEEEEPGRPTSPANEELRYFAAGAGPVRARSEEAESVGKEGGGLGESSLRAGKRARTGGEDEGQEESEAEEDSSDRRRAKANRRKRRKSDKGGQVEPTQGVAVVKREERDSGYDEEEEARPPARRRLSTATSAKPPPAPSTTASARKPGKYDRPLKNSPATLKASATASTSTARPLELNPARNLGEKEAFKETVRGKEQRRQMFASACEECTAYYARSARDPPAGPCAHSGAKRRTGNSFLDDRHEREQMRLQQISRHRDSTRPDEEPPHFWKMGFPPTQAVDEINQLAREQKEERRRFQEAEAEKRNGRYRYKE